MTDYHANHELAAAQSAQESHEAALATYQANNEAAEAAYEQAHDAWQAVHDAWAADLTDPESGEPLPEPSGEPQPPEPPPPPEPPEVALPVYAARDLSEPESLATAYGEALVFPPSLVLTSGDRSFAITPDDLERGYTPVGAKR